MGDANDSVLGCSQQAHAPLRGAGAPLLYLRRLVPFVLSFLTACDTGPRTFADFENGHVGIDSREAEALRGLLAAAGLAPRQLGVEGELAGVPNWVEIDDQGHIWALGLEAVPDLDSLAALAGLPELSRVRIRGASLAGLEGLSGATSLTHLTIVGSGLSSVGGLDECQALQVLDLRGNRVESLAGLAELPKLRTLDLADNAISDLSGLAGQPGLESLNLSGNQLVSAREIERLPRLERLILARNRITRLDGLKDLPRLRELLVDDNRLIDAAAVDALPALELVNLNGNQLERFPRLVSRMPQHLWQGNPGFNRHMSEDVEAKLDRERSVRFAESLPGGDFDTSWSRGGCAWTSNRPRCDMRVPRVSGAGNVVLTRLDPASLKTDPRQRPPRIRLHLEVGKGRVRAYLAQTTEGYPYAEADSTGSATDSTGSATDSTGSATDSMGGEKGVVEGNLHANSHAVWFVLEAVGGVAEDVRYRIEPEFGS